MNKVLLVSVLALSACRGPEGPAGSPGAPGEPGAPGQTVASSFCEVGNNFNASLLFQYQSILFDSGDRLVLCSVTDSGASFSDAEFYPANSSGVASGHCIVRDQTDFTFSDTGTTTEVQFNTTTVTLTSSCP